MNAPLKDPRHSAFHRRYVELKPISNPDQWDISTPKFSDCDAHIRAIAAANDGQSFPFMQTVEIRADPRPAGGMRSILTETAEAHGYTAEDFMSTSRKAHLAHARQDFMWRCRQITWADGKPRYSLPQIGQFLGGMDHTTILHGVRAHEARLVEHGGAVG